MNPSPQDRIRSMGYLDDIEDAVLGLIAVRQLRVRWRPQKQGSGAKLNCRMSSSSGDKGFIIRFLDDRIEIEPAVGSGLYETLVNLMAGKVSRAEQGGRLGNWVLKAGEETSATTSEILIKFVQQLSSLSRKM